jgi:hypothetical protein
MELKEGEMKLCKREELELSKGKGLSSTVGRDWSLKFSRRDVLELRRSSVEWRGSSSERLRTKGPKISRKEGLELGSIRGRGRNVSLFLGRD